MRVRSNRHGFTLAETAIALLVVSAGILSVFALFPVGLENSRAASADVEAGLFAEKVFESFRAKFGAGDWTSTSVTLDAANNPYLTASTQIVGLTTPTATQFDLVDKVANITNTVWYKLSAVPYPATNFERMQLTLVVWPQKTKPDELKTPGRTFYTEITRQVL